MAKRQKQPDGIKPHDYLRFAESFAVRTRKLLLALDHSVPKDDAFQMLSWIELLSRKGRKMNAVEARRFAVKVELLVDQVRTELTEFLDI